MTEADIAEILRLPADERLRLVELIWESLAPDSASLPLSSAHREIIDARVKEHERNPEAVLSRSEVLSKARLG